MDIYEQVEKLLNGEPLKRGWALEELHRIAIVDGFYWREYRIHKAGNFLVEARSSFQAANELAGNKGMEGLASTHRNGGKEWERMARECLKNL